MWQDSELKYGNFMLVLLHVYEYCKLSRTLIRAA